MKTYEVTITETLQKTVEMEANSREEAERLVEKNWNNSEYILDADSFVAAWISLQGRTSAAVIMNAEYISVGGKMFGLWDERYAIYQQASPL